MKRNTSQKLAVAGVLLAAAWVSSESAFGQSIAYQLATSDSTSDVTNLSTTQYVSYINGFDGTKAGAKFSFDVLGLVSGGANVASSSFYYGEFKVASAINGSAAALTGNMTFTPAAQFANTGTAGAATANLFVIPSTNTTSAVGLQVGDPSQTTSPQAGNGTTVVVNLGNTTASSAAPTALGLETINSVTYNVFKLGTLTFTTSADAAAGESDTISIVPVSADAGTAYYPQKAIIDGAEARFKSAAFANPLNIVTAGPGDTNGDAIVGSLDFGTLVNHYDDQHLGTGVTNGANDGDFNGDGFVDSTDFGTLVNFFTGDPSGSLLAGPSQAIVSSAVPEPTALALLAVAPVIAMRRRRAK